MTSDDRGHKQACLPQRRYVVLCLSVTVLTTSCAFHQPHGASFSGLQSAPAGKAIVYFYRPTDESFGSDRVYDLSINGAKVVELLYGGYFPFVTDPGRITAHADTHFTSQMFIPCLIPLACVGVATEAAIGYGAATVNLDVVDGSTRFVRFHPITHAASFEPTLSVVSDDIGFKELDGTKLLARASDN
jgi:hypothetical protein